MGWPLIASAVIGAAGSIYSSKQQQKAMSKLGDAPVPPDYKWMQEQGPSIWNNLRDLGYQDAYNPRGMGEAKPYAQSLVKGSAAAGYGASQRSINRNLATTGLSPGGGHSTRQQYYAGQQFADVQSRGLTQIEMADIQMKEEQRQRGMNMLFSLTNKSPVYSQIVSQNYWNALNATNAGAFASYDAWGQVAGGLSDAYLANQYQNPYENQQPYYGGQGQGQGQGQDPYGAGGYTYGQTVGPPDPYQTGTV